ncbi:MULTISPECIES: AI-2E family transporter [Myxococcaceae]|uniref:AI-2E family transporter n=1 Tax=Myxococcaceae TaxID=31 RepID=UPI001E486770|nr:MULTISPECIES: AI-2E family transporter [Myxococcaceae]
MATQNPQTAQRALAVLLIIALVLLALIIQPFASAFFLAAVLAGALRPVQTWLTRKLRGRKNVSAALMCIGIILVLVGPIAGIATFVVSEISTGVKYVSQTVRSEGVTGLVDRLPPSAQKLARKALDRIPVEEGQLDEEIQKRAQSQSGRAAAAVTSAVAATGSFAVQATMMLIAFFFFLVDGRALVGWLEDVSPLLPGQVTELLEEFRKVSVSVMVSTIATSGVQAVAALIGYFIARVPYPVFFAVMTFFVAFIPAIGAAGVCLFAALILLALGKTWMALFLAIWGVTVVGLVDNLLKPVLAKKGMEMHGAVVFFALLGGLAVFGTVGLLIGPLIVSFFLALFRMRQRAVGRAKPPPPGAVPLPPPATQTLPHQG